MQQNQEETNQPKDGEQPDPNPTDSTVETPVEESTGDIPPIITEDHEPTGGPRKPRKRVDTSSTASPSATSPVATPPPASEYKELDFGDLDVVIKENSDNQKIHATIKEGVHTGKLVTVDLAPFAVGSIPKQQTRKTGLEGFSSRRRVTTHSDIHQAYNYVRNVNWISRSHGPSSKSTLETWVQTHVLEGPMKKFFVTQPNNKLNVPIYDIENENIHDIRAYDSEPKVYHLDVPASNAKNGDSFYYELGDQLSLDDALFSAFNVVFLLSKQHLYRHNVPVDWRFKTFTHQNVAAHLLHLGDGWILPYIYEEHTSSRDGFLHHARFATGILTMNVVSHEYPSLFVFLRTK